MKRLEGGKPLGGDDQGDFAVDGGVGDEGDQKHLRQVHEQFDQIAVAAAEDAAKAAQGVERPEVGLEAADIEKRSDLREIGEDGDEAGSGKERRKRTCHGAQREAWCRCAGRPCRRRSKIRPAFRPSDP
jgi:hypothetical protein